MTVWLSVDTGIDGHVMPFVDVWTSLPKMTRAGSCVAYTSDDGQLTGHVVSLPRKVAHEEFGTVPDNPRQIIRVKRRYTEPDDIDAYLEYLTKL